MTLPNFLIIGSAKCGTTSLYSYLYQHPQVFMSTPKEPTFFGNEGPELLYNGPHDEDRAYHSKTITDLKTYTALFDNAKDAKAIGEASIFYMYLPKAPEQIKKYVPRAKMFAILRNPADRAYSAYLHAVRQGRERRSFEEGLKLEPERIRQKWNPLWHFKAMGFYAEQVKRFYDMFGREQVRIYLYEDLQNAPLQLIKEVLDVLEVDSSFVPDMSKRFKESHVPKIPAVEMILHKTKYQISVSAQHLPERIRWRTQYVKRAIDRVSDVNRMKPPRIPAEIRMRLLDEYRDDILRLGDLLRRDLTHWCNPVPAQVATVAQ
jgi:sulfotransferase family protein